MMKNWLYPFCFLLLFSCKKIDERGRFRADFIGRYHCDVQITSVYFTGPVTDSTVITHVSDTVSVYLGEAFDELILLDDTIKVNSNGDYFGDHKVADPGAFSISFSDQDVMHMNYDFTESSSLAKKLEYSGEKIDP